MFAENPAYARVPGVCSIPVYILQQKRLWIRVMLCASHRYRLKSRTVVVLDLEKNIAAWGKDLAKASLPSNSLAEAGAGAPWGPEGMCLPLALGEKQMKMFVLGAVGIL